MRSSKYNHFSRLLVECNSIVMKLELKYTQLMELLQ
jgi:hypothetical protein